jgi:UDP-glucuronate 4-epimerase
MADEHFLVTGGNGCIGAWVVRDLVAQGAAVTVYSGHGRPDRLRLVMSEPEIARIDMESGDINDLDTLESIFRRRPVTHVIHLAALQLPFCAADPIAGARVNVQGTQTMFELVRRSGIERMVYASSVAVYGPRSRYADEVLPADAELFPTSFYGVYKVANEHSARVAWDTQGISSIGLRPHSIYGPGRDQGMTSKPTLALIAAAAGRPYHVEFGGRYQFQFAGDVAAWFIAAARSELDGAHVFNLPGPMIGVDEIVGAAIDLVPEARGHIDHGERQLPFPSAADGRPIEDVLGARPATPLRDGVQQTISAYRDGIARGLVDEAFLDRVLST